jgi:hypothetical protein
MKKNYFSLISCFLLVLFAGAAKAQSTFSNLPNSITLSITTTDCNGFSPATGAYSISLTYNDGITHTYNSASVQVTSFGTPGNMTVFIDASLSTPTASWPDLTSVNSGGFTLTQAGGISFMYQFQFNQLVCAALPITLEFFHSALSGSYANLTWRTDMEQNTSYINVQRAVAASPGTFVNVGIEPATGNSNTPIDYSFTAPIVAGNNFFRLQFVDLDGRLTYSPIAVVGAPAGSYPTSLCSFTTLTGPATLCSGSSGVYRLHNSAPGISWSVSPTNDALATSNGGTEATVTNFSYTGSTTLTAASAGCSKALAIAGSVSGSLTISGPSSICTGSASYTLSNLTGVSSVTWSVFPASLASLSTANGASTTLTRTGTASGTATLTAVYTFSGCSSPISVSTNLFIGTPPGNISVTISCPLLRAIATASGATSYTWYLLDQTAGTQITTTTTSATYSHSISNGHQYNVAYSYSNSCGTSNLVYGGDIYACNVNGCPVPRAVNISPNPSRGLVVLNVPVCPKVIAAPEAAGQAAKVESASASPVAAAHLLAAAQAMKTATPASISAPSEKTMIYEVRVVDKAGKIRKIFRYSQGIDNITLDLSGLPSDVYTLQVFDNKNWTAQQIVLTK